VQAQSRTCLPPPGGHEGIHSLQRLGGYQWCVCLSPSISEKRFFPLLPLSSSSRPRRIHPLPSHSFPLSDSVLFRSFLRQTLSLFSSIFVPRTRNYHSFGGDCGDISVGSVVALCKAKKTWMKYLVGNRKNTHTKDHTVVLHAPKTGLSGYNCI